MPTIEEEFLFPEMNSLKLRLLLYGPEKCKKTWWACAAAEAGFNVILLDSDDGAHIIKRINPKAWKRIFHVNIVDGIERPIACEFMTRFLSGKQFIWDETSREVCLVKSAIKPDHKYIECDAAKLSMNDIVILDSWSAVTKSLVWRWYRENNVDISSGDHVRSSDWPGYRWSGTMASYFLRQGKAIPCHFIVIAHQTIYEKHKRVMVGNKERDVVEWSRLQIQSTSGPHAMTMGVEFSDILRFYFVGDNIKISTIAEDGILGGARLIAPGTYKWDDLQFADICEEAKIYIPEDAPEQQALLRVDNENIEDKLDNSFGGLIQSTEAEQSSFASLLKPVKKD